MNPNSGKSIECWIEILDDENGRRGAEKDEAILIQRCYLNQAESLRPMAVAWYLTKKAKRLASRGHWHQKKQISALKGREA